MNRLIVSELFGPTVQGEGPSVGRRCYFLRLGGCNQHCKWCDTAYTWRFTDDHPHDFAPVYNKKEQLTTYTVDEVYSKLIKHIDDNTLLVVSGGEPMLQANYLSELFYMLKSKTPLTRIEIETAGTIYNEMLSHNGIVFFNVSPKLENSGNPKELRYRPDELKKLNQTNRAIFKFVVSELSDFVEIEEIVNEVGIDNSKVYIMPLGIDSQTIDDTLATVAQEAIDRKWNLTSRLHVTLWGNQRGK